MERISLVVSHLIQYFFFLLPQYSRERSIRTFRDREGFDFFFFVFPGTLERRRCHRRTHEPRGVLGSGIWRQVIHLAFYVNIQVSAREGSTTDVTNLIDEHQVQDRTIRAMPKFLPHQLELESVRRSDIDEENVFSFLRVSWKD